MIAAAGSDLFPDFGPPTKLKMFQAIGGHCWNFGEAIGREHMDQGLERFTNICMVCFIV